MTRKEKLIQHARDFLTSKTYSPTFTELEIKVLRPFFTNLDKRVFFLHTLPEAVIDVLLSMYSRIKNKRGLRGLFVDSFLPLFLASRLEEVEENFGGITENFIKFHKIDSLDKFYQYSPKSADLLGTFQLSLSVNPDYIQEFASAPKVKNFLTMYLDQYGHNSIARMAKLSLCFENISILAAKSIEWTRPGSGYIELSTRYVDMSGKDMYPIEDEIAEFGIESPQQVKDVMNTAFNYYRELQGINFTGPFSKFLHQKYGHLFPKDLERGIIGETCDVLGNFLPCATLTSVGVAISGEAFPELIKHLILDNTSENLVLVDMILDEAKKIGGDQFSRHYEPSQWKKTFWNYLNPDEFFNGPFRELREGKVWESTFSYVPDSLAWPILWSSFHKRLPFSSSPSRKFETILEKIKKIKRGEFDKLPNDFENISGTFSGIMSFRGWRDLQRQQFCNHFRTYVTPLLGFYKYNKAAPQELFDACLDVYKKNMELYCEMLKYHVPDELMQYPLAMGNMIGFQIGANLAEFEFCIWQRSKYNVNHEVREKFIEMENMLRKIYPWWQEISRADITPAYIFARTNQGIPLAKI